MKSFFKTKGFLLILTICIITSTIFISCTSSNKSPEILSVEAQYTNVYPQKISEIECIASDPEGDDLKFKWTCTDGSFIGSGPVVTWKAPNYYGNYHIMVIVEDKNGGSTSSSLTIQVIANINEHKPCCGKS